jgi:hypothetical protein
MYMPVEYVASMSVSIELLISSPSDAVAADSGSTPGMETPQKVCKPRGVVMQAHDAPTDGGGMPRSHTLGDLNDLGVLPAQRATVAYYLSLSAHVSVSDCARV